MLTSKLVPSVIWPVSVLPKSVSKKVPLSSSFRRFVEVRSGSSLKEVFTVKRAYVRTSIKTRRSSLKPKNRKNMLALAAGAVLVAGGSAAYSTDARSTENPSSEAPAPVQPVKLDSAVFQIPHPEKKHKGGEDTFLLSSSGAVIGVFDGMWFICPKLSFPFSFLVVHMLWHPEGHFWCY